MELFRRLNDEGTTIIQVTHSDTNAAYGHRVIELLDGWIASERKTEVRPHPPSPDAAPPPGPHAGHGSSAAP
jgi:ABC-type siderophore export system fused ATPase/permease subunit